MTATPFDLDVGIGRLTARQRQVLAHAANGLTNAQIGRQLALSPPTINRHLAAIYKALGARDRANAVALALLSGDLFREDIQIPQRAARRKKP
ncbi:helix-turn-helix transcriptional regulator [Streptomyces sp. NPDC006872]|uniref:response regulator transcription factor n=1 Tax=Streptomyces sp. NPDC006872 TaxID=3155720 RepID=UPI0033D50BB2